jgi:hypothetical protein
MSACFVVSIHKSRTICFNAIIGMFLGNQQIGQVTKNNSYMIFPQKRIVA